MGRINGNDEWSQGNFHRDTLIYSLGRLGETVLRNAFADETFCRNLMRWNGARAQERRAARADGSATRISEPLMTLQAQGAQLTLVARDSEHEFFVDCQHFSFSALLAIAFLPSSGRLTANWVARFRGDVSEAIVFSRGLQIELAKRLGPRSAVQVPAERSGTTLFSWSAPIRGQGDN